MSKLAPDSECFHGAGCALRVASGPRPGSLLAVPRTATEQLAAVLQRQQQSQRNQQSQPEHSQQAQQEQQIEQRQSGEPLCLPCSLGQPPGLISCQKTNLLPSQSPPLHSIMPPPALEPAPKQPHLRPQQPIYLPSPRPHHKLPHSTPQMSAAMPPHHVPHLPAGQPLNQPARSGSPSRGEHLLARLPDAATSSSAGAYSGNRYSELDEFRGISSGRTDEHLSTASLPRGRAPGRVPGEMWRDEAGTLYKSERAIRDNLLLPMRIE